MLILRGARSNEGPRTGVWQNCTGKTTNHKSLLHLRTGRRGCARAQPERSIRRRLKNPKWTTQHARTNVLEPTPELNTSNGRGPAHRNSFAASRCFGRDKPATAQTKDPHPRNKYWRTRQNSRQKYCEILRAINCGHLFGRHQHFHRF